MPTYDTRASIGFDLRATGREVPRQLRDDVADLRRELDGFQSTLERGNASSRESAEAFALLASRALTAREAFRELAGAKVDNSAAITATRDETEALATLKEAIDGVASARQAAPGGKDQAGQEGIREEIRLLELLVKALTEASQVAVGSHQAGAQAAAQEAEAVRKSNDSLIQGNRKAIQSAEELARAKERQAQAEAKAAGEAMRVRINSYVAAEQADEEVERAREKVAKAEQLVKDREDRASKLNEGTVKRVAAEKSLANAVEAAAKRRVELDEAVAASALKQAEASRQATGSASADIQQQIADRERLHEALARMEARDRENASQGVSSPRTAQAIADAKQEFDAKSELQAALREMNRRTAEQEKQDAATTKAARREGTQAIADHITAVRGEIAAEKGATDAADDYAAAIERSRAAGVRDANAKTWLDKQNEDWREAMALALQHEKVAKTVQVHAGATASAGIKGAKDAAGATKEWNGQLLSVAYAFDDLRYGFGAIVNNIPQLALATGMTAGWAGGIAIAGVAIDTLARNFGPSMNEVMVGLGLAQDKTLQWAGSIDGLKGKLEALESKTYKVNVDYIEIQQLKEAAADAQAALAAFEAHRKTNLQQEAGKQATQAADLYGGGSKELRDIVFSDDPELLRQKYADPQLLRKIRGSQTLLAKAREDAANGVGKPGYDLQLEQYIAEQEAEVQKQVREGVKKEVGFFYEGRFDAIQAMQKRARERPNLFKNVGPGGITFGESVLNLPSTAGETLEQINTEKSIAEGERELNEFIQRNRANRQKAQQEQNRVAQAVGPAFADDLTDRIYQAAKSGGDADRTAAGLRPRVAADLQSRGVAADQVGQVADRILEKATEAAKNAVMSGEPPKLQRERDQERGRTVADAARDFSDRDNVQADLYAQAAAGRDPAAAGRDIEQQVRRNLANSGVPADLVGDVAAKIMEDAMVAVNRHLASGTKPSVIRREDAGTGRAAASIEKAYGPTIRAEIAQNRLAQTQGLPVAGTFEQAAEFQAFGQPFAATDELMAQNLARRVNNQLIRSGQGDQPGVSDEVVRRGFEQVGTATAQAFAQTNNAIAALNQVINDALGKISRERQGLANNLRANRRQQGRFAQQMPPVGDIFVPMGGGAW